MDRVLVARDGSVRLGGPGGGLGQVTSVSAYASNRPTAMTDPTGMEPRPHHLSGPPPPTATDPYVTQRAAAKEAVAEAEAFVAQVGDEAVDPGLRRTHHGTISRGRGPDDKRPRTLSGS